MSSRVLSSVLRWVASLDVICHGKTVIPLYISLFTWNIYVCPKCPLQSKQVAVLHFLVIPGLEIPGDYSTY